MLLKGYPRAPSRADVDFGCRLRSVTVGKLHQCQALLYSLRHHSTMDAVASLGADRLLRSLRDECRKRGIDPDAAIAERLSGPAKGKVAPPESLGESAGPMIVE
jgi:hypothetical protein